MRALPGDRLVAQAKPKTKPKGPPIPGLSSVKRPSVAADLDSGTIKLQGKGISARVQAAVINFQLESRIDGSGTLTLQVYDYSKALLRSQLLTGAVTMDFDGVNWTMVKLAAGDNDVTLTFEETAVSTLRLYDTPKKADRTATTRAQFVRSMITEVKEYKIPYRIPEVNKRQAVAPTSSPQRFH